MIALLITILLISVASSGFCVFTFFTLKNKSDIIAKNNDAVSELYKEISDLRKDIMYLKNNPAEFTNRFSIVDFRLKKMEDVLTSMNNGFRMQESWMR